MDDAPAPARRRGGRADRTARRQAPEPEVNPAPPGQPGGRYKPLTEGEAARITDAAFDTLAEIGMGEAPPVLVEAATAKGAGRGPKGRLTFSRAYMEDVIDRAAKGFVFHGRDPAHDFEIAVGPVRFGTGGAAVRTLDLETNEYRPSTLADLYDFARMAEALINVSWFTRCCVATDVPDLLDLDVNTVFAMLAGTTKPMGTSISDPAHVDPLVDMLDIAAGGEGRFAARPFLKAHISPIISPLRYGDEAVETARHCIRRGVPINAITGAQAGATGPAAPAGMLAQSLAETMAALAMVDAFSPGYPMIFSDWPFVVDLRTGAFSGGGGEIALMNAAAAQLSNRLGLPSGVACSMADAKAVDAQMGAEKALTALAAGLAGGSMIYESVGMSASLLGASAAAMALDDEMLSHVYRVLRGVEVTDETLSLDAIRRAALETGHFLGAPETLAAMQRDYVYPRLGDRDEPDTWAEKGSREAAERARERAQAILSAPAPDLLGAKARAEIEARFRILPLR